MMQPCCSERASPLRVRDWNDDDFIMTLGAIEIVQFPCTGGEEQPEAAGHEGLLQERLKEAEEKVAHLNTMIAGPPPLEVRTLSLTHREVQALPETS